MKIETKVNVLILCMSTINGSLKLNYYYNHYEGKENFYGCVGQLEPACKAIIDRLDSDMTCKQKLRIVVLNTEKTANEMNNDKFRIQAPDNIQYASVYDFFVSRIESYIEGKENDKIYEVGKEEIDNEMKIAIDNIIDSIGNYDRKGQLSEECKNINDLKEIIDNKNSCDLIVYASEIERVLKTEIENRFEQRYQLNDRDNALLERDEESRDYLAELKKGEENQLADKRIRDFFETLKSREDEFTDIKNKEEKIEKEIKNSNDNSYAFKMISSLEKRYKKLRIWYKVQLVGLNDIYQKQVLSNKIEELTKQYEKAITDLQNREMELFGIIQKLQRQLDDIKKRYQNTVLQYLHDELWKKIVLTSSQSTEKKKRNVEIEKWIPITVRRNIDDKIEEIVNAIKGNDTKIPRVFVDTQGGYRDNVMILASIMEMLKVSGISTEDTYAVNFHSSNFASEIITNTDKYKMFDMVSGMDEFLGYMHISKLMEFFDNRYQGIFGNNRNELAEEKETWKQIETAISKGKKFFMDKLKFISEHMLLCHVNNIDKELKKFEEEYFKWFEKNNNSYIYIKTKLFDVKKRYGENKNIMEYIEDILSYLELFSFAMRNIKIHFLDKVIIKDKSGNISCSMLI